MGFVKTLFATWLAAAVAPALAAAEAQDPAATSADWRVCVQRGLAEGEYHARKNSRGLQAPNRAHDLRAYFEPGGIRVHSRTEAESPELVSLSLAGVGRRDALAPVAAGDVAYAGARVEIRRPGIVEWYENSAQGLEQGFTLGSRPRGDGPLILELAVGSARAVPKGDSVVLATEAGRRLRYGGLKVFDDCNLSIAACLEVPAPNAVRLVIEDDKATYPLVIDPVITGEADFMMESNQPDPVGFVPAAFGGSVASAGDVNGDGYDDVIVGAPGWDGGDPHEGAAFVFLGSAEGIVGSDPATAHAWIESNQFGAQLGTVSGAGDVNGDGFDDIIVGAHFYSSVLPGTALEVNGAAFIFHGSAAGITGTDPTTADAWIEANQLQSDLGQTVSGGGDVNGDGYDDVIISIPDQGIPFPPPIPPNQGSGDIGMALVFHGSPAGIVGTGPSNADAVLTPYPQEKPDTSTGTMKMVSMAGDVNGDGYDDVIIAGSKTTVFLGSESGIVGEDYSTAHAVIEGFGGVVDGAGDVNGDGFDDILLGAPFFPVQNSTTQEGAAFVFLGSAAGITATDIADAHASFFGNLLAEWLGASVAGVGDVDGDGFDDVAFAARVYPGSFDNEGVAYLFRGSSAGITAASLLEGDVRLEARQSGAVVLGPNAAFNVDAAGDINGDGFDDVIMGKGYWGMPFN